MELALLSSESMRMARMLVSANRTLKMALAVRLGIERAIALCYAPRNYWESIILPGWDISGIICIAILFFQYITAIKL
jgi:hypothetical protein